MLSLLRWGLGSGHEQEDITTKVRVQEEERSQQRSLAPKMTSGNGTVKRKRGKSTQSISRPAKRHPKASKKDTTLAADLASEPGDNTVVNSGTTQETAVDGMEWDQVTDIPESTDSTGTDAEEKRLAQLRGAISRQFNLEILLKHNELRLIDQEIAKVQTALEQLRRCSVVPYPALTGNSEDILNVAHGQGIPAQTPLGLQPATHPAPWGVVEGPYSRHYAKWLLPDPAFDGTNPAAVRPAPQAGKTIPDRHTRGGKELSLPLKSRQRPGPARYQALGNVDGELKNTKGPMILKRNLDGKLVKLVCLHCHREDFNSAQGFINHCRIAHSHNLASHEAAARECGQEIDPNEVVMTVPETQTPVVATPVQIIPAAGLVHPMNRAVPPPVPRLSIPQPKRTSQPIVKPVQEPAPVIGSKTGTFKPSTQVPHLSRLFARLGQAVDLTAAVDDATVKTVDDDDHSTEGSEGSDDEADTEDGDTTPTSTSMARSHSRISTRGGPSLSNGTNRPKSNKGPDRGSHRTYNNSRSTQITLPDRKDTQDLSPNTITSVNAPSLISDSDNASSEDDEEYASTVHVESSSEEDSDHQDSENEDIDVDMNEDIALTDGFGKDHASSSHTDDPELRVSSKARNHHTTSSVSRSRATKNQQPKARRRR